MKKTFSLILVGTMLLTSMSVFAAEGMTTATTGTVSSANNIYIGNPSSTLTIAAASTTVADSVYQSPEIDIEVNKIINIDGDVDITIELEKIVIELDKYKNYSKEEVGKVLKDIYVYLAKRDLYYKNVLKVLDRIEGTNSKAVKTAAIIEFERRYDRQKELDRKIHNKIERIGADLKTNSDKLGTIEKEALIKIYKPVVTKYYEHRKLLIHINNRIQNIKKLVLVSEMSGLINMAEKYYTQGQLSKAAEYYEKAIANKVADKDTFKKAGTVLKQLEGEGPKIFVNGKRPVFDVKPQIIDNRTMVPFRAIANALGVADQDINWNGDTSTITMTKAGKAIELKIGEKAVKVNGKVIAVDVPALIENGRTLVPVRLVSEALDGKVDYDADTGVVTIEDAFGTAENQVNETDILSNGMITIDKSISNVSEEDALKSINSTDSAKTN